MVSILTSGGCRPPPGEEDTGTVLMTVDSTAVAGWSATGSGTEMATDPGSAVPSLPGFPWGWTRLEVMRMGCFRAAWPKSARRLEVALVTASITLATPDDGVAGWGGAGVVSTSNPPAANSSADQWTRGRIERATRIGLIVNLDVGRPKAKTRLTWEYLADFFFSNCISRIF